MSPNFVRTSRARRSGEILHRSAALECVLAGELAAIESHELVATTRVGGFLGAIELHDEVQAEWVTDQILDLGFITRPLRGNSVQISPPFITMDQEVRDLVNGVRHVLDDIRSGKVRASA